MILYASFRQCQHCRGMIGPQQRADAVFCKPSCRVAALRKRRKLAKQQAILTAASERWDKEVQDARAIKAVPKKPKAAKKKSRPKPAPKRTR